VLVTLAKVINHLSLVLLFIVPGFFWPCETLLVSWLNWSIVQIEAGRLLHIIVVVELFTGSVGWSCLHHLSLLGRLIIVVLLAFLLVLHILASTSRILIALSPLLLACILGFFLGTAALILVPIVTLTFILTIVVLS